MPEEIKAGVRDTDLTIWSIVIFIIAIGDIVIALGLFSGRVYAYFTTNIQPLLDGFFTLIGVSPAFWPPQELLFIGLGVGALIWGVGFIILGYGIWTVKSWARILAILAGFLLLPVGGLGIVVLWYFFRTETKERFSGSA
ncbi:MAG: hypothetical protein HWN65_17030 [Candidatus Helarchaeota archaeon]|nr:hypothetical protein [Candidatus Helarchaeota archaeon]